MSVRTELAKLEGERLRVRGRFDRFGWKPAIAIPPVRTFCLVDVQSVDGNPLAEHLWFTLTQGFASVLPLSQGKILEFDARVSRYHRKMYNGNRPVRHPENSDRIDFRLARATNIEVVRR